MMRDISLHIMDIMQNSIDAGASEIGLILETKTDEDLLYVTIIDNGCGMDEEFLKRVTDPFTTSRTTRQVGLGISMFRLSGEICGGSFELWSEKGKGTSITVSYGISHIDRIPLGEIGNAVSSTILSYPLVKYTMMTKGGNMEISFDTDEVKKRIAGVSVSEYNVIKWVREYINEGIVNSFRGILKEL